jgi:hypothetical protein
MQVRTRSLGVAATAVALLLSGCNSNDGESAERRTEQAMRQVLKEYQPRFEQRRAALDAVAASVSGASSAKPSCDRKPDPEPKFTSTSSRSLAGDSYNSPDKGGNVDALQVSEAASPEAMENRPARSQFILEPGWLVRGLWITGPQGPLGTDHFKVDSQYGYEPYDGAEKDPVVRLSKILDVGLHKRYVVLYRVTSFGDPDPDDNDPQDIVTADAFLADLEKRDLLCRFVATGHSYDMAGSEIRVHSTTPYEDMQTTFQLDIDDKLRDLTGR